MLISGTLRDNIDLLGQYSDKEIWEALEKTRMKQKFESDSGLKTIVD
jgi:ABC-type multidrug transport system fused ATPase/permease subunit